MNRFFLLLGLGMCTLATAQFPYSASVFEETYTPLTNPIGLGIDVGWDDPEVEIPLPFEVSIGEDDDIVTVLQISGTGEMLMGLSASAALNILWPISLDVMDIGAVEIEEESHIQYEVTGTSPNRILKVEWDEVGLYEEISELGTTTMRLSFQTWLYENGNIIEYRFGPNTMGGPARAAPAVGNTQGWARWDRPRFRSPSGATQVPCRRTASSARRSGGSCPTALPTRRRSSPACPAAPASAPPRGT